MTRLDRILNRSTRGMDESPPTSARFIFWLLVNASASAWAIRSDMKGKVTK